MIESLSILLAGAGTLFFIAGMCGLLNFPDLYTRLHALTKADNLGLGFIVLSLILQAESAVIVLKLILIWFFVIFSSATSGYLIARVALDMKVEPFRKYKESES